MQRLTGAIVPSQTQPTWVIRLSGNLTLVKVAEAVRLTGVNCDITGGFGVWNRAVENSVTITVQADTMTVNRLLQALAWNLPEDVVWVHVEHHDVPTQYVDFDVVRGLTPDEYADWDMHPDYGPMPKADMPAV